MVNNVNIAIAFDEDALKLISQIYMRHCGNKSYIDYSNEYIKNFLGYYTRVLDCIYRREILPVVLPSVHKKTRDNKAVSNFILDYGYFIDNKSINYANKKSRLVKDYLTPFNYKNKEYPAPFAVDEIDNAEVVAEASLSHCNLVVLNPEKFISRQGEEISNSRALGITEVNFKNNVYEIIDHGRITTKPLNIITFSTIVKDGVEGFATPSPKYLRRAGSSDYMYTI